MEELRQLRSGPSRQNPLADPSPLSIWQKMLHGLLQPLHAVALLARDRELLMEALLPALLLLGFCLSVGFFKALLFSDEPGFLQTMCKTALHSFVVLAPVPSIIMANHYGRLGAQAHERMQLGACKPRQRPLVSSALLAVRQVVVVAVVVLPLSLAAHLVPWVGGLIAKGLLLVWAMHWIVVEALDDGSVMLEGESEPAPPPAQTPQRPWTPWFLWPVHAVGTCLPSVPGAPLRFFVRRSGWLCSPWRHEVTLVEQNVPVMLGFTMTTAALLCTPVLNLVFRPITVVAAVRLLGQLRLAADRATPAAADPALAPAALNAQGAPPPASAYAAQPQEGSC